MRHRRRGRKLGRNPKHQRALLRNMASSLFLTERDAEFDDNQPKVKGRIVTTISKAKEVRPLVEKCITIARRGIEAEEAAAQHETDADRGAEQWKAWRTGQSWHDWNDAISPAVAARRRCLRLLGDKEAVAVLFDEVAPRFMDRNGGYTRVVRLAKPRLGDAGVRAILEFVGEHDRVVERSEKPAFEDQSPATGQETADANDEEAAEAGDETAEADSPADADDSKAAESRE